MVLSNSYQGTELRTWNTPTTLHFYLLTSKGINFLIDWRLKWTDTASSSHHQSIRCYLRIGKNRYLRCTWTLNDWELMEVLFINETEFRKLVAWGGNIYAYFKGPLDVSSAKHLRRWHDISMSLKGRVYITTVHPEMLPGCEAWPLRVQDVRRLNVFDARCLGNIVHVW